jgi:hypothetical protein
MTAHIVTLPSTENARLWWQAESRRVGTDWDTLGRAAARVFWRLELTSSHCWGSS